jgi:drug/metabolite transporter (DMT)-like permease
MSIHVTTGRWRLGLALSLVTAFLWGALPIALKGLLDSMDAFTITWYRFLAAAFVLAVFIIRKNGFPSTRMIKGSRLSLLIVASIGLCGSYILNLLGLRYLSPSTATVVVQLAPIFMLIGGLVFFRERFSLLQWSGFVLVVGGLVIFFNDRFEELLNPTGDYTIGVLLIIASAIMWAFYALSQKQLLKTFSSGTILLWIYILAIVLFFPFAQPSHLFQLDIGPFLLLLFCAFNTLAAYGCFSEALDHWEASRISMVLATIPLITVIGMKLCSILFPGYMEPERLNLWSIFGAFIIVVGSVLCALGQKDQNSKPD